MNSNSFLHSALAISVAGECLGLFYEKIWTRVKAPRKTALNAHQYVPVSQTESFKWVEAVRAVDTSLEGLKKRPELVFIGDRVADIYEHLAEYIETGHGFVVRVSCNRVVASKEPYLLDALKDIEPQGSYNLQLRTEDGQLQQGTIELRFGPLTHLAQRRKGFETGSSQGERNQHHRTRSPMRSSSY